MVVVVILVFEDDDDDKVDDDGEDPSFPETALFVLAFLPFAFPFRQTTKTSSEHNVKKTQAKR